MHPRRELETKSRIVRQMRKPAGPVSSHMDSDKKKVMKCLCRLVAKDYASWRKLRNGTVWFRMHSGETYLLEETLIRRIA